MAKKGNTDRGIEKRADGQYDIRYADVLGHMRLEFAGSRSRARELYRQRKREVWLARQSPDLAGPRSTFAEIAREALTYCRRHADYSTDEERMRRMLDWWAAVPAAALTPQEIEARFSTMMVASHRRPGTAPKPVSGATINRYRALLSLVYRLAQKHGRVPVGFNPARLVERRKEPTRVRWLQADEEVRLRQVLEREYGSGSLQAAVLDLALNCGLRWGDQKALEIDQRDGDCLLVDISKTGQPLALRMNEIATAAFDLLAEEAEIAGRGRRLSPTRGVRHWFERACSLAGIRDFHWHDLRHTFATRLLEAGVPAERVQKYLGHKTITMTLRYAHVVEGHHGDDLARLNEINALCAAGGATVTSIDGAMAKRKG